MSADLFNDAENDMIDDQDNSDMDMEDEPNTQPKGDDDMNDDEQDDDDNEDDDENDDDDDDDDDDGTEGNDASEGADGNSGNEGEEETGANEAKVEDEIENKGDGQESRAGDQRANPASSSHAGDGAPGANATDFSATEGARGAGIDNTNASSTGPTGTSQAPKPVLDFQGIRESAVRAVKAASEFDISPMVAIPYAQQCHAVAISEGPKWLLTGGEDGFIRKYDFAASIDGKAPLTVAQKHNLMDNVNKAGVIGSYWENEQPLTKSQIMNENPKISESEFSSNHASYEPKTNPVYALGVERNGLWCLSGLLSGGISLYTLVYNEGNIHHYFRHTSNKRAAPSLNNGHSDAISALQVSYSQTSFLSGSWDKCIREWDLNTGKTLNLYSGSTGQISRLRYRPLGLTDITFTETSSDADSLFGSDEDDDDKEDAGLRENGAKDVKSDPGKNKALTDDKVFMSSSIDGTINIWDARVSGANSVLKLGVPDGTPPWCMDSCWSNDGDKIYVGRRNSTVEEISLRMPHATQNNVLVPNVLKRLAFPKISGPVSALSIMPNDNFVFCGSQDNIRLYNLKLYDEFTQETAISRKRATPFYVIPGHNGGVLSNLIVEDTGRFMITASGNRGWGQSPYADVVLIYSIDTGPSART